MSAETFSKISSMKSGRDVVSCSKLCENSAAGECTVSAGSVALQGQGDSCEECRK